MPCSALDGLVPVCEGLGHAAQRHRMEMFAIISRKHAKGGRTQPRRNLDQRVEYGLQVEGRAANDLQHVAGRGLVFE